MSPKSNRRKGRAFGHASTRSVSRRASLRKTQTEVRSGAMLKKLVISGVLIVFLAAAVYGAIRLVNYERVQASSCTSFTDNISNIASTAGQVQLRQLKALITDKISRPYFAQLKNYQKSYCYYLRAYAEAYTAEYDPARIDLVYAKEQSAAYAQKISAVQAYVTQQLDAQQLG